MKGVPRGTVKSFRVLAYEYAYNKTPSDHWAQGVQSGWDINRWIRKGVLFSGCVVGLPACLVKQFRA